MCLKTMHIYSFVVLEVKGLSLTRLKSSVGMVMFLQDSSGTSVSLCFLAFQGLLPPLTHGLLLHLQSALKTPVFASTSHLLLTLDLFPLIGGLLWLH